MRLAARLALLAMRAPIKSKEFFAKSTDAELAPLLRLLYGVCHPEEPLPIAPGKLAATAVQRGSIESLERRARLLLAAVRPELFPESDLLQLIESSSGDERAMAIVSLALARKRGTARARALDDLPQLEASMFVLGLASASDSLRKRLTAGPSRARSEAWRRRWWEAAVRLAKPEEVAGLAAPLLAAGGEGRPGLRVLCRRVLLGDSVTFPPPVREKLLAALTVPGDRWRAVLGYLASDMKRLPPNASSALSERERYALGLLAKKQLSSADVWRVLADGDWMRLEAGPGSFEAALLDELNLLVRDLFVGGSKYAIARGSVAGYLPNGVQKSQDEYFEVLDQLLGRYPLFRSWR